MNKHNSGNAISTAQPKVTQLKEIFKYLKSKPATATQVSVALNIYRPNISWRKRELETTGLLMEVKKVKCPITKHWAMLLTCNPDLFPANTQLKLWGELDT